MAVKLVLMGIAAGLAATTGVLALGGGVGLAMLAYIGGGMVGMAGGMAGVLVPKTEGALAVSSSQQPSPNLRHPT
jgi:hypothetical protein